MVAVHIDSAALAWSRCVGLAEYRLDDLARISGVSARNIRAYRERGLLDPPRRVGRSAYYDDYHLSQLRTINQLLRRGFNSAHIAEFFASMRQGADLADILGIQRAILGPPSGEAGAPHVGGRRAVDIDPDCEEARQLVHHGLAEAIDNAVVLTDPTIGEIVARTSDQLLYVRALLRMYDATRDAIDGLATAFVNVLEECVSSRFGKTYIPKPDEMAELTRIVQDYRDLGTRLLSERLEASLQQQMVTAVSEYTAGVLLSGKWEPKTQHAAEPRNRR
jgi:DNA-binding transcriptional MerR regulator